MGIENPILTPILTERRQKAGPFITTCTIDGPNGSGKTTIHGILAGFQQIVYGIKQNIDSHGKPAPVMPVFTVQEPPNIPFDTGRADTYRSLAKSHVSRDGVFTETQLKDPLTQAVIFLMGRRKLEKKIVYSLPLADDRYEDDFLFRDSIKDYQPYLFSEGQQVRDIRDLVMSGGLTILKDRGTSSTCVYQGMMGESTDSEVISLVRKLYDTNFLLKEDLTIIITPESDGDLNREPSRDFQEPDAYSGYSDMDKYLKLRELSPIFTNRIVYLRNDPKGRRGDLTIPIIFSSLLLTATQELKATNQPIPINKEFDVHFPIASLVRWAEDRMDLNLPLHFAQESLKIRRNSKEKKGYVAVCGDVGILNFDEARQIATVMVRPNLEDRLEET